MTSNVQLLGLNSMKKQQGVTLVELLIVVVIIAIITSIAYPAYTEQIRQTRRADCAAMLTGLGSAMERYFTINNTYVGSSAATPGAPTIYATSCPSDGSTPTYNLSIEAAGASTYEIRAVPIGAAAQAGDKCGSLTLTNTGRKNVAGQHTGVTWQECW